MIAFIPSFGVLCQCDCGTSYNAYPHYGTHYGSNLDFCITCGTPFHVRDCWAPSCFQIIAMVGEHQERDMDNPGYCYKHDPAL